MVGNSTEKSMPISPSRSCISLGSIAVARSSTLLVGRCHQTIEGALLPGSSKFAAGLANPPQKRLTPSFPNSLATYSLSAGAYSTQWPSASITGCPNRALISADFDDFPFDILNIFLRTNPPDVQRPATAGKFRP